MKICILIAIAGLIGLNAFSQHEHHMPVDTVPKKKDTTPMKPAAKKMATMDTMDHSMHEVHTMPSHAYSRNLSMSRNGSGTGWNPDASPMYMWMKSTKET